MALQIRPAGSYKLGRKLWVKVAGVWRRVVWMYYRKAAGFVVNSNYSSGLEVNSFVINSDVGSLNGNTTYSMSGSATERPELGQSCMVQKDAFFSNVVVTYASNNFRNINCTVSVYGADVFPLPSSVTVTLYNSAGNSLGSLTLPLVSNNGVNARYEVTGAGAAALVDAARYDTYLASPSTTRRVAVYF